LALGSATPLPHKSDLLFLREFTTHEPFKISFVEECPVKLTTTLIRKDASWLLEILRSATSSTYQMTLLYHVLNTAVGTLSIVS